MKTRLPVLMLTIVELATLAAPATGSIFPCTRPCYLPGIPDRDYQYGSHSPIQEAVSAQGVTVELEVAPGLGKAGPLERFKHFHLAKQAGLQVGYCAISRVALVLNANGEFILSLRAYQDPAVPLSPAAMPPNQNVDFLKRNKFHVRVLCYGAFPVYEKALDKSSGKPVLCQLEPEGFWVQRGVPLDYRIQGYSPDAQRYFSRIDRILVVFSYQ